MSVKELNNLTKKLEYLFSKQYNQRAESNANRIQIFVHDRVLTKNLILKALLLGKVPNAGAVANLFLSEIDKELEQIERKALATRDTKANKLRTLADIREGRVQGRLAKIASSKNHRAYLVLNYAVIQKAKTKLGRRVSAYTRLKGEKTVNKRIITGASSKGQSAEGAQIGHGEFGSAVVHHKILKAEQAIAKFSGNAQALSNLNVIKQVYEVTTKLDHTQVLTSTGQFKKEFAIITSNQSTAQNATDAKEERSIGKAVLSLLKKEVVNFRASPSIKDATTSTVLYNLTNGTRMKVSSKDTPKSKVVSRTKTSRKSKQTRTQKVQTRSFSLYENSDTVANPTSRNNTGKLMAAINARLPATVAKNMGSPRLNMRTGRFASSARVAAITRTSQGFASIAYTYMLYPYQTFEPGYAQGSIERDPRPLISQSVRELASQYMEGRFYTKRV